MEVNLNINDEDLDIIVDIVNKANDEYKAIHNESLNIISTKMDIIAVHLNDMPLDLQKLRDAPAFDLIHDVIGISNNIDRKTGKLKNCFLPRCAR